MQAKKKGIRIYKVKMNNNAWTLFTTKPAAGAQMKENNNHPILLPTSWLKWKCTTMKRNKKDEKSLTAFPANAEAAAQRRKNKRMLRPFPIPKT